jgi:cell division protease FtsH
MNILADIGNFSMVAVFLYIAANIIAAFTDNRRNAFFPMSNKDNVVDKSNINITLADWAGSPEVFDECFEIVSYIKNSTLYEAAGATIPKGILLDGPPGTGKTLLAKAIAGETNATFISMSGSEFVEMYVGLGASKVRQLFDEARENTPSIIFIDEIDAVGKKRGGANAMNTNDEREQTLNQILAEMDGFSPNAGVSVLAATNRRDVLDEALLRPGRFDRLIYVPLPDRNSREAILKLYLKNKKTTSDIQLKELAEITAGFSGAQIKNLLNEAAILAARNGQTVVTKQYLEDAFEKIVVGITKKTDVRSLAARTRVAIHEIGHALLVAYFKDWFELKKVSMKTSYNGVGGYTLFEENEDVHDSGLYTKDMLMKRIIISFGGKAAELLAYGEDGMSNGASQDLKQANELARQMVEQFGMGAMLESFSTGGVRNSFSEKTREQIDYEIIEIVDQCFKEALSILMENKQATDRLLPMLLDANVLEGSVVISAM